MSGNDSNEDLAATQTPGYKPPEKKTVEELAQLDAQDESLRKWKESLGLKAAGPSDDPRKVIVLSLAMETPDRPDVVVDLSTPAAIAALKGQQMTIKEGAEYRLKVNFKVQHDVVSGLKYLHVVKRKGIRVDKAEEMLGSYGPSTETYEKKFPTEVAPEGMLARGHYDVKSKFVDDDNTTHLEWSWSFDIKKGWD
ncbi:immunoglobulin E-set [Gaertneriomyces semiglobifer]|nr:immunoglobulin E-set [Gaertneriomyces semiglobifer]